MPVEREYMGNLRKDNLEMSKSGQEALLKREPLTVPQALWSQLSHSSKVIWVMGKN